MFSTPEPAQPVLPAAPPPPVLAGSPQGSKPKKKSSQPSMIGTGLDDSSSSVGTNPFQGKTLLGQ